MLDPGEYRIDTIMGLKHWFGYGTYVYRSWFRVLGNIIQNRNQIQPLCQGKQKSRTTLWEEKFFFVLLTMRLDDET